MLVVRARSECRFFVMRYIVVKVGGLICVYHSTGAMIMQCLFVPLDFEESMELFIGDRKAFVVQL